jgi:hypothetical protein
LFVTSRFSNKKFLPTVCRLAAFAGKLWRRVRKARKCPILVCFMKKCIFSTTIVVRYAELVVKSKNKYGKENSEPVLLSMNLEMVKYS